MILVIFLGALFFCVYFMPTWVAGTRDKKDSTAIFLLNLFLGWTLVGWVVALVWACMEDTKPAVSYPPQIKADAVSKLRDLDALLKSGTLTEQEFTTLKSRIIQ
jgi:Superinfection immunity protein